jgi:hypothetical protein
MVRHATAKKRRSGVKVTRKPPKHGNLKVKNALKDNRIKALWDGEKSPADNLTSMGLEKNVNKLKTGRDVEAPSGFLGYARISSSEVLNQAPDVNHRRKVMSESDQAYAAKCLAKHKYNYEKMQLDIRINDKQLTEQQLRKLCEKFLNLSDSDRDVAIPAM